MTMVVVLFCVTVFSFLCLVCAQSNNCGTSAAPLVTHGRPISHGEYPWLAALYQLDEEGEWSQYCGGALISPRIVLTAAHCLVFGRKVIKPENIKVGLGMLYRDFYHYEDYAIISNVRKVVVHPRFFGFLSRFSLDVGLVKLSIMVEMSDYILPVCIDLNIITTVSNGALVHAAGWGTSENGTSTERALAADLSYLDNYECLVQSRERYRNYITLEKFCALSTNGSQVDKGDSGGALTFYKNGRHFVLGVVSSKIKDETSFSIFTDLSNLEIRSWLKKKTAILNRPECGVSFQPLSDDQNNDGRVTHGEFPWIAAIYDYDEEWLFRCSGTLISTHIVLTVASCLTYSDGGTYEPEDIKVALGKYNKIFDRNDRHSIIVTVSNVVTHYYYMGNTSNYEFDVALLDLAVSVKPTPYINPACLLGQPTTNINLDGEGYMVGWNWLYLTDEPLLYQASLSSRAACLKRLPKTNKYRRLLVQDKMCAERISGSDHHDNGMQGAALTAYVQDAHYVVGVCSIKSAAPSTNLYLLTDLRNEELVDWLQSEKIILDFSLAIRLLKI